MENPSSRGVLLVSGAAIAISIRGKIKTSASSAKDFQIINRLAIGWSRVLLRGKFGIFMTKTQKQRVRSREDISEMPEWMKEKQCPHKKQYMSGKRIMPKNLTGKEKLPYLIDEVFLAYNSARLKEVCQLFADRML